VLPNCFVPIAVAVTVAVAVTSGAGFRIFGCPVYFHVPKEKRSKLDPSGRKGTFVRYNESS
jgi:hypothetical protein